MTLYQDNFEHLEDEFARLNDRLRTAIDPDGAGQIPLMRDDAASPARGAAAGDRNIDDRVAASVSNGVDLRLVRLSRTFGLTAFEIDVILLALAPQVDLRYEQVYAQVQGDPTLHRPTIDLAMRLSCTMARDRLSARRAFADDAALLRYGLVALCDPVGVGAPLTARIVSLDASMAAFLLAEPPGPSDDDAVEDTDAAAHLPEAKPVTRLLADSGTRVACVLTGPADTHFSVARSVARSAALTLRRVESSGRQGTTAAVLRSAFRDATLGRQAVYLADWSDVLADPNAPTAAAALRAACRTFPCPVFLSLPERAGETGPEAARPTRIAGDVGRPCVELRVRPPNALARRSLWQTCFGAVDLSHVAAAYRFTPAQVRDAAEEARLHAELRGGPGASVDAGDVLAGCRRIAARRPVAFARVVNLTRGWERLVLPAEAAGQLREFADQVRHRLRVFDDWNFVSRVGGCRGIVALFMGPSGTGKTLAAEVVAGDLGLNLHRVDVAAVVSKYIGETEKNLDRVFADAQESGALLFFDECDALFGKRSEVKDAHDRYANLETGFLLQRLEQHDGPVVLATNLRANVDDAFTRRLSFAIDFPFPDEAQRLRLWQGMFPAEAPVGGDVDLPQLARQFRLSGGNIRNAAVAAAFLAAADGQVITLPHVIRSVRREYQKLGRTCDRGEFGIYFDLL